MLLWNTSLQWHDKWRKRLFIYFLRDGYSFSYTCFGRWYFLLANQIAHLTTHKPVKIHVIKIKVKLKFVAQASTVWMKWFQLWMLVNLTEKEGNVQNIQVPEEKKQTRRGTILFSFKWKWRKLAQFGSPRTCLRRWNAYRSSCLVKFYWSIQFCFPIWVEKFNEYHCRWGSTFLRRKRLRENHILWKVWKSKQGHAKFAVRRSETVP